MEPKHPIGPLSGLALLTIGSLMLLACLSAAAGPGRRDAAAFASAPQSQSLHSLPPIPFGR